MSGDIDYDVLAELIREMKGQIDNHSRRISELETRAAAPPAPVVVEVRVK